MADDALPTRDQLAAAYRRDYKFRVPDARVDEGTQPHTESVLISDLGMTILSVADKIRDRQDLRRRRGADLDEVGELEGVARPPAAGGSGFVRVNASAGGGTIQAGDILTTKDGNLRFQCRVTGLYNASTPVPIIGITTGPATNLKPGTILRWVSPRQGIGMEATVLEQGTGNGLTGGRDEATDDEYIDLIIERRANRAIQWNDAAYHKAVEETPGLAVQKAFSWPAIDGPGHIAVGFTLNPDGVGGSRVPSGAQRSQVASRLELLFPGDDGVFVVEFVDQFVEVALQVAWRSTARGWTDIAPWPTYVPGNMVRVLGTPTPTATTFRVTGGLSLAPKVGQTLALYDRVAGRFRPKRILTATLAAPNTWDIVCDTTNDASDTSYTPVAQQKVSPWSDSLQSLVDPVDLYFRGLGPGEMYASFSTPGRRRRRQPQSPEEWPSIITNQLINPVQDLATVAYADLLLPATPYATPVGTPGVSAYLFRLGDFAVFP